MWVDDAPAVDGLGDLRRFPPDRDHLDFRTFVFAGDQIMTAGVPTWVIVEGFQAMPDSFRDSGQVRAHFQPAGLC
jgi:hypothetical protein